MKSKEILDKWLERVGAKLMWQLDGAPGTQVKFTSCYLINLKPVIVLTYFRGWDVFIPSYTKFPMDEQKANDTIQSLDGAAIALGTMGCAGLMSEETENVL